MGLEDEPSSQVSSSHPPGLALVFDITYFAVQHVITARRCSLAVANIRYRNLSHGNKTQKRCTAGTKNDPGIPLSLALDRKVVVDIFVVNLHDSIWTVVLSVLF